VNITERKKPAVQSKVKAAIRRLPGIISKGKSNAASVWDDRAKYEKQYGSVSEVFSLPSREKQTWHNPFGN
jgi:hypothetical protein